MKPISHETKILYDAALIKKGVSLPANFPLNQDSIIPIGATSSICFEL
jgi:hypothetical protein